MASTNISGGCRNIFFLAAIVLVGFLAWRTYQLSDQVNVNPPSPAAPGERAFKSAEELIVRNSGTGAFGNSEEAKVLAGKFSKQMGVLREQWFTAAEEGDFSLSDGVFLTHCNLVEGRCIFLVHVPQLRNFTDDAQTALAELAWICANQILADADRPDIKHLAVGVKGVIKFGAIYTGSPDGSGEPLSGIRSKANEFSDKRRLYRYYYEPRIEKPKSSRPPGGPATVGAETAGETEAEAEAEAEKPATSAQPDRVVVPE